MSEQQQTAAGNRAPSAARFISLENRMAAAQYRPAGFDYLRVILALLIVGDHAVLVCSGPDAQRWFASGELRPLFAALIPMFFALSGFLVASSLVRTHSVITFVGLRILRIVPALAVDTLFCALILGVIFTDEPLRQYFSSPDFRKYFLNIIGEIHYVLPGVFTRNPVNVVNSQLWTIPYELKCYAVLTLAAIVGLPRRPALMLAATVLSIVLTMIYVTKHPVEVIDLWHLLLPSFLLGVCAYLYRDRIPWSGSLFALSAVAAILLLNLKNEFLVLGTIPLTYVTVWCGLLEPKRDPLIRSGDYSYAIYLYSFPIQQAIFAAVPAGRVWWANILLAVPLTFVLAALSWHFVEKRAQTNRRHLYAFDTWLHTLFHPHNKEIVGKTAIPGGGSPLGPSTG